MVGTTDQRHLWDTQQYLFPTGLPTVTGGGYYTQSPYAAAPAPGTRPARTSTMYYQQHDAMGNPVGSPIPSTSVGAAPGLPPIGNSNNAPRPNPAWPNPSTFPMPGSGTPGTTTPPATTPTNPATPTTPTPTTPRGSGFDQFLPAFAAYLGQNGVLDINTLRNATKAGAYQPSQSAADNRTSFEQYLQNQPR